MENKTYQGAVLVIGSLRWDNNNRNAWRENRLEVDNLIRVHAPIRYGRLSTQEKRKNTYTMVLSQGCYTQGMGLALLIPLQNRVASFDALEVEAKELWKAEGGKAGQIAGNWGAVGLVPNTNRTLPDGFVDKWKSLYNEQPNKPVFDKVPDTPMLNEGILALRWITSANENEPVDFDFILAAATEPKTETGKYPTGQEIAKSFNDNKYFEYFCNNLKYHIHTFQDEEIKKHIKCE